MDISIENQPRAKRLKSEAAAASIGTVPFSERSDNFNQRHTSTSLNCNKEKTGRIVPNVDSPISSTTEKRNDNVMSFLTNIPVASSANFSQSPTKVPVVIFIKT